MRLQSVHLIATLGSVLLSFAVLPTAVSAKTKVQPQPRPKLTTLESKFSVKETIDRLTAAVEERGMKVVARVDHAAGAKAVGLELPPTEVLMFGNPKLGTPLMMSNPAAGIDLPMRVIAWQDKAAQDKTGQDKTGKVWIAYTAPADLGVRHGIKDRDEVLKLMAGALGGLVKNASGQ
jgi:uncharacterized protein (DUF302 family)